MYESILTGRVVLHNKMMQLRKVCNHPYLFHPYFRSVAGAKPFDVDQDLVKVCGMLVSSHFPVSIAISDICSDITLQVNLLYWIKYYPN
jgi:hypothetical protein